MTSIPTFKGLRSYLPLCHNKAMYDDSTHSKKSLGTWILSFNYYYRVDIDVLNPLTLSLLQKLH